MSTFPARPTSIRSSTAASGYGIQPLLAGLALAVMLGCRDASPDRRALDAPPATQLAGAWEITLWLDRPMTIGVDRATMPPSVAGSLCLLVDHRGRLSYPELGDATHIGVFDIDFRPFGMPVLDEGTIPVVVARTTRTGATHARSPSAQSLDSLAIVLDPGTRRYPFRLAGAFTADSVTGTWTAGYALGGGGRFVLRRPRPHP